MSNQSNPTPAMPISDERLEKLRELYATEAQNADEMMSECCTEESLNGYQASLDQANESLSIINELLTLHRALREAREALEAGSTLLQETGHRHVYRDGKTYSRHECQQLAATLSRMARETK